ncbi:hypothetical protein [Streptomyces zingiberis]|uniref:Uncharacterized protein n=1 Tax=Streptomyces zingiberis TaxID=2053010 RepID=A0ABX1BPY0_9ACTN|nr:hypothetical protein [Streptomyces zingiberis]NJP99788.1 hypothetical protein [Streptomyces zingiberis]
MPDLVRRLAHRLGALLGPGTGTHRAGGPRHARPAHVPARAADAVRLPLPRSPYGRYRPLDGAGSRLVRPYRVAHEQEQVRRRQERARRGRCRVTFVLAADPGSGLGRHLTGAGKVAA